MPKKGMMSYSNKGSHDKPAPSMQYEVTDPEHTKSYLKDMSSRIKSKKGGGMAKGGTSSRANRDNEGSPGYHAPTS